MKKNIFIFLLLTILTFGSDKGYIPKEDIVYKPIEMSKYDNNSVDIITGRDQAIKKTQTIFTYNDNSVYEIYATPNFLTTLQLNHDEKVTFLAGGDTENWQIEETNGGKKNNTFIFIKPLEEDLKTNVVITTNKRIYNLRINSTLSEYNSLVKWNYPEDSLMIAKFNDENTQLSTTNAEDINLNYYIGSKDYYFAPKNVYDDGNKTYFIMKENIQELPILFAKGDDNQYSQVTFRVEKKGTDVLYTVDRTASRFKFQIGKKSVIVVNRNYR